MNLLDHGTVKKLIAEIESNQNKKRREDEVKAFEVYSGNLKDHVESRIKEIYPKTYKSFTIADLNMSKKICDKLAKAYKSSPYRELGTVKESEEYQTFLKDSNSIHAWQTFDLYYNLHRSACMWFNYVKDENGEMRTILRPLASFQFTRVLDKMGKDKVFIVNFPSQDFYESLDTDYSQSNIQDSVNDTDTKRYALWTDSQHVIVNCKRADKDITVEYEKIEDNEESVNPLGKIPAVFAQQGDNAALPIVNPLTNQTIEFNAQYSSMLTGSNVQTFGHLVLSHPQDQKMPDEIYNSLFTYSRLPQIEGDVPTKLDYLNPSPNLDSQLGVIRDYGQQIISEHLGDGSQMIGGKDTFTSGLDRMIAQSDISNMIESNQQVYSKVEQDLYEVVRAFFEAMNIKTFRTEEIVVKYDKAKPIQSEDEILKNIQTKIDLGLIEKYEALMLLDPNMDAEKAKEKIEAVKKERMESVNSFMESDANIEEEV